VNKVDELIKKLSEFKEILAKRAPKGVDPEKHESCVMDLKAKGHDVGSAHAICTSSMKKDEVEKCSYNKGGQWKLEKDNSVKPFGQNIYNSTANINRKATRTGEERPEMGRNQGVRQYTTSGSSMSQAHEKAQEKEQKAKSKASVRTLKDMTPEEQAEMRAKYEKPLVKGIDAAKEALTTGNLPVLGSTPSQPTDEQVFGHLVKTEEQVAAEQENYENRMQKTVEALQKPVDHLNKSQVEAEWSYGKSFNSLLKETLSEKELAERNAYIGE
jgi:hypothetical protein